MSTGTTNRLHNGPTGGEGTSGERCCSEQGREAVIGIVRERPLTSTMIAFGIGLGVGAVIGTLLSEPADHRRQYLAGAGSLGHRMLDTIASHAPQRVKQYLPS